MHAPKARLGLAGLSFAFGLVAQSGPSAAKAQELTFTTGGVAVRRTSEGGVPHAAASRDGGRTWQPLGDPDDVLYFRRAQYDPVRGDVQLPGLLGAPKTNRLFLVQFQTQILAEYQQALRDRGVEILHYLPEDALFVRADRDRAMALRELPCVRWVGDLQNG